MASSRAFRDRRERPGFTISEPTMGGKWLELLKEIAPSVTRVLVPHNSATQSGLLSAEYYHELVENHRFVP